MITKEQILVLLKYKLVESQVFVVELEIKSGNNIYLEIDSIKGVSIKDCVDFSRQIEHNLDRETEDFELHVSSPGLDKPLRVFQQYVKNIGRELKIVLTNNELLEGKLKEVNSEEIVITYTLIEKIEGKKKKQTTIKEETIPFTKIKESTIIISFK